MYAIQGAMAVRRERNKRRARRISQLRRGSQSGSLYSVVLEDEEEERPPPKTSSSLTAFHVGVVFILLGFIMIFSSLIGTSNLREYEFDEEERAQQRSDWSKLLGVGVTFIIIGLLMVMVNRIITAREEEELEEYVKRRLARSRSGHALVREPPEHYSRRRLSSHPTLLQQQQLLASRAVGSVSSKSPRPKSIHSESGGRRTNGSAKMERSGSIHSRSASHRQSFRDTAKKATSPSQIPSVTIEQELDPRRFPPPDKAEAERLLTLQPSPSVSYTSELSDSRQRRDSQTIVPEELGMGRRQDKLRSSRRKRRQD